MRPNLLLYAGAALLLAGCRSTPDWNNGPYAEYGFTYDLSLSPIACLSVEDAKTVLAIPSGYAPWTTAPGTGQLITFNSMAISQQASRLSQAPQAGNSGPSNGAQTTRPKPAPAPPAQ
jgi:hypothetical protein